MSNAYQTETQPVPGSQPFRGNEFGTALGDPIDTLAQNWVAERKLPCNVGRREQAIRLGTGTALLVAAAFAPVSRGWRITLAALGAVELITGGTRYCPVWQALGVDTRREWEV